MRIDSLELTISLESTLYEFPEFRSERLLIEQVVYSQARSTGLGRVSWSDTFPGGSDIRSTEFNLFESIDDLMEIENDVGSVRNE